VIGLQIAVIILTIAMFISTATVRRLNRRIEACENEILGGWVNDKPKARARATKKGKRR
jgi:predicted Holliday junction resolvase-like endonuclease